MRTPRRRAAGIAGVTLSLVVLTGIAGCADSPTQPEPEPLAGVWVGSLAPAPGGVDWTSVRLTLRVDGDRVTGQLVNHLGESWEVEGETGPESSAGLTVVGYGAGDSSCYWLSIYIRTVEWYARMPVAVTGELMGRCYGTVSVAFRLERDF